MEQLKIGDKVRVFDRSSAFYGSTGVIIGLTAWAGVEMVRIALDANSFFGSNVVMNEDSVIKL